MRHLTQKEIYFVRRNNKLHSLRKLTSRFCAAVIFHAVHMMYKPNSLINV